MTKKKILDLGRQPIANKFLAKDEISNEFFYDLEVSFDDKTKLVSLINLVPPEEMFNDEYVYQSSGSHTMREHFEDVAKFIKSFSPTRVLEIGSNDGVFLKHFNKNVAESVEPCGNFAQITRDMGYTTLTEFWSMETAKKLDKKYQVIYAANCFCHMHNLNDAFKAIESVLDENGIFIIEDPSLLKMVEHGSYDQIYDEHAHIFSAHSIKALGEHAGLKLIDSTQLEIHGGSNRHTLCKVDSPLTETPSVLENLSREVAAGVDSIEGLKEFEDAVKNSQQELRNILLTYKGEGKRIISYGATSKSTTVFNYCQLGPETIEYIIDTTPDKIGRLSPGVHIPVVNCPDGIPNDVDVVFLGAWNFEKEILLKEKAFLDRGGVFIAHVPNVRTIENLNVV
jgi:SAM-dependent methyltransferase